MGMTELERRKLWVRSGGRCALCKRYLLEGDLTFVERSLGEGAHIVGQQVSAGSPRGMDPLPEADRDLASNIILACSSCHTEIDKTGVDAVMTVEKLREIKQAHEAHIRHVTCLDAQARTAVLRVQGAVRGAVPQFSRAQAASAVIESESRFPLFLPAFDQQGIEIDLRGIDGEEDGSLEYYRQAAGKIDRFVHDRLLDAVREGALDHLSVFAIARLPLLVLLGARLDDTLATDVYQRHRSSEGWAWPSGASPVDFGFAVVTGTLAGAQHIAVITNLSGTTSAAELPDAASIDAVVVIAPLDHVSGEDVVSSRHTLANFEACVRGVFDAIEAQSKHARGVHLFGGLPVAAAVSLGRALKAPDLRAPVTLYDRDATGYYPVLEV